MKLIKIVFLLMIVLFMITGSALAQTSGTTTKPTATTSTNRQQELYDQYHGITKKPATTAPVATPATTPAQPQRQTTSGYGNATSTTTASRPQTVSYNGSTSGVRIGVRGGVTYEQFTEQHPLFDPIFGFVGGLTFNLGGGTFSFQPEVNYTRYSVKITESFSGARITSASDHIEIPLFLKISTGSYAGHRFFINIGPYGSYLISASSGGKKLQVDVLSNRFSFGAAAGVGAALKIGTGHVIIEARGLYELSDTNNGFNSNYKQILTQGTVGYIFPLGGR